MGIVWTMLSQYLPIPSFPSFLFYREEVQVLMGGMSGSGKTTILNRLKLINNNSSTVGGGNSGTPMAMAMARDRNNSQPMANPFANDPNSKGQTIPTVGYNVEMVSHKNKDFFIWDFQGLEKNPRNFWHYFFPETKAVIFVVDSEDRKRISMVKKEIDLVLEQMRSASGQLQDAVLLIWANKQDSTKAMTVEEIIQKLGLHLLQNPDPGQEKNGDCENNEPPKKIMWHIRGCSVGPDSDTSNSSNKGLQEGLSWIADNIQRGPSSSSKSNSGHSKNE